MELRRRGDNTTYTRIEHPVFLSTTGTPFLLQVCMYPPFGKIILFKFKFTFETLILYI